ncbi:hypothetical protein Tco_0606705 [Tanacetum coccineum]
MIHPQSYQMIHPQSYQVIHPQSSQVIHQQASQAPAVSLQSSADPIQVDSSLVVPYFLPTDDPLECLNKALTFMSTILALSYLSSNNQLETSSNPMHQVAMPERQTLSYDARIQLSKDQLAILADTRERIDSGPGAFTVTTNALFQADGVEVYDSDCDDVPNAQPSFMANISSSDSDVLTEVHNHDNMDNNMINQVVQAMPSSEQLSVVNHSDTEITSDSNIIPYSHVNDTLTAELERYKEQVKVLKVGQNVEVTSRDNFLDSHEQNAKIDRLKQTLSKQLKEKESLMKIVTVLKNDFKKEESRNIDREIALEKKIKQLENIVYKRDQLVQNVHMLTKPKFFYDHSTKQALDPSPSCRPTKVEVPKELPKVSMVNTSLKKLKHHLAGFDVVVKERTTTTAITEDSWGFEHTKSCFRDGIIPFVKALKDIFNTFDQYLINELTKVQNVFHQMEHAMEQHSLESKMFEVKMNKVLNENERLLEQVISKDIVNIIVNSYADNAYVNVHECEKCLKLETELLNKKDFIEKEIYDKLFRSYTTLEKHCISLESQKKDTVIKKLKEKIKSLSRNMNEDMVKKDIEEIETINIELDQRVSKLIAENKHLKQTYKQLYDSIKPTRIRSKEQCDALIAQINAKSVENSVDPN